MANYTIRLSNWMEDLPEDLKDRPLNMLATPGSHDSLTYAISLTARPAPDLEEFLMGPYRYIPFSRFFLSPFFRGWCRTQKKNTEDQLKAGIRYFDLRVAPRKKTKDLAVVHGLYSCDLQPRLSKINSYLDSHTKEIAILDFQHFYSFSTALHDNLIEVIKNTFSHKICPKMNVATATLSQLASNNQRVIVIYRENSQAKKDPLLWEAENWPSAWPNTMNTDKMIKYAESHLGYRSKQRGFITQFILTPDADAIKSNPLAGVKDACAKKAHPVVKTWLKEKGRQFSPAVVIADYIDAGKNSFSADVIAVNFKASDSIKFI